jgi:NADH dehydrogenase FAD-containing subunit
MGCNSSTAQGATEVSSLVPFPNPNGKKTVLIVGFSIAGYTVGEAIWDDANVVFIDARDHFEYVPTVLKSAIDEKWKDRIFATYAESVSGYKNKFSFVQATLLNVNGDGKTIEVELAQGKRKTNLSYDVLVLATGFKYESPIK